MDHHYFIIFPVVLHVILAVVGAVQEIAQTSDGRSHRRPIAQKFSLRSDAWKKIMEDELMSGWFKRNLRCTKKTFFRTVGMVEERWTYCNDLPDPFTTNFLILDRVAVTLYYLCNGGTYHGAGIVFGMSKTRVWFYVNEVCEVLLTYEDDIIRLPTCLEEWDKISGGFEKQNGFPNICGAIDGTLIEIKAFKDSEGWFCRKHFPAFNLQIVVNDTMAIMSYSLRSGSQNDKSVFNMSNLEKFKDDVVNGVSFRGPELIFGLFLDPLVRPI
jgi:hypothetical protein